MAGELWNGADVRWAGPEQERDGVRLRPGDRGVVVDAGRHHITSFTAMYSPGKPPAGRGVAVRFADGRQVRVPAHRLELVAPDHPLRPAPEAAAADWWLDQLAPWGRELPVAAFVPRSLPAVCRVLHPWQNRDGRPVRWEAVADAAGGVSLAALPTSLDASHHGDGHPPGGDRFHEPGEGLLDNATAEAIVDVVASATATPDDVYVAVWTGFGDIPPARFPGAAEIPTPQRGHFLLRGPLRGVLTPVSVPPSSDDPASGIWWPADRAWFVATEIDFAWTFVAGSHDLVDRLLAHDRLETVPASHDDPANRLPS